MERNRFGLLYGCHVGCPQWFVQSQSPCSLDSAGVSHVFNSGPRAAAFSGLFGGVFLAVIEGINIGLQKYMSPNSQMQQVLVVCTRTLFKVETVVTFLCRNKSEWFVSSRSACRLRGCRLPSLRGGRKCSWETRCSSSSSSSSSQNRSLQTSMMNRLHHTPSCGSVHFSRTLDHTHCQVVGILHPAFGSFTCICAPWPRIICTVAVSGYCHRCASDTRYFNESDYFSLLNDRSHLHAAL